jgi:hypothetical protein
MIILEKDVNGLRQAADLIHSSEVILWPSCGVSGLACHANKREAVSRETKVSLYPNK